MSRGPGVVQQEILQRCWAKADAQPGAPDTWWVTLDQLAGRKRTPIRESCRRAISRLAAAGELERGWRQGVVRDNHWVEDVYAAEDLPFPLSQSRLLCCRIPPALMRRSSANT